MGGNEFIAQYIGIQNDSHCFLICGMYYYFPFGSLEIIEQAFSQAKVKEDCIAALLGIKKD